MSEKYPFTVRVNRRDREPQNHASPNIRHAMGIADKYIGKPDTRSVRVLQEVYVWVAGQTDD